MQRYEIIVIGGGAAGWAAAISSARAGKRTLLLERFGYLGGWATAALVNPFMSHRASDGETLVGGLYKELRDRLAAEGSLLGNSFDSETLRFVMQESLLESGAQLRLHTVFDAAKYLPDKKISVVTRSKSGVEEFVCDRLVDCSGDGDAAAALGAGFETGDENGVPQAVTLMFDMGGVDLEKVMTYVRDHPDQMRFPKLPAESEPAKLAEGVVSVAGYYDLIAEARSKGEYQAAGELIFFIGRPHKGEVVFNTTHVGNIDGTNAEDLTKAEIESRKQMASIVSFVKKYVPGFEKSYLLRSAEHVGIRETRRIFGDYVFCADDVIEARKFGDCICRLAYPVDIHAGKGDGYTKAEGRQAPNVPPPGDWYEIPYRCLLPLGLENVLVAGRCVSSTQAGHGAIRIIPACVAMGQAAGTAAAISLEHGVSVREIDNTMLMDSLRAQGALV